MARPVTLFTGQWADLPLADLAAKTGDWGFDGLELACWGDHFDPIAAVNDSSYASGQRKLLEQHGLGVWAIGCHLVGQAVADPIDGRHQAVVPPEVWGDGDPEGVRRRAADYMKDTARAATALGVDVVTGFTGSPVWHLLYSFPPNDWSVVEAGYQEFAERWGPIIDVYESEGVKFALEVHPTEIAYDFVTTRKALDALGDRPGFGINFDPSHFEHQFLDSAAFITEFGDEDLPRAHQGLRPPARRPVVDPRRPPRLRPARPRLGLRLARARRRRLRVDDPRAQPGRLRGSAVHRVGGLGDGPRLGRARRARLRPPHRLRPVCRGLRRRVREGTLMSEKEVGFVTMGKASGGGAVETIGVGMLGYAFMGKAHSNAYKTLSYMAWPPPYMPELVAIAGRNEEAVTEAARRYGFADAVTDWKQLVADDRIQLFDNAGPNALHAEPTIAAAEAGKHVICEKPLGRDAAESYETWQRVQAAGVKHMCAFNYRFVPAVRLARQMIESGELGEIQHFRGAYLQEWGTTEGEIWRFTKAEAGSGALGDLGAHVVDLARYLVGSEITDVAAMTQTFMPGREVDDAVESVVKFEGGAVGTIEASRFCQGRKNHFTWEINGSKGSLSFDLERLNELEHSEGNKGFRTILVSEADHPFWEFWWPQGHMIGWEHSFVHEIHHLLTAIRDDTDVAPHGATLEDGYRAAEVCDAMLRSAEQGGRETVQYRS